MKILRATIENFRQIEHTDLDFTDSLGRPRSRLLLVGPNGCGKTTVLDALAAALGPTSELPATRHDLTLAPALVRRGALKARVSCDVRFTPDERAAVREVFALAERTERVPNVEDVTLTWTYPDERSRWGYTACKPRNAWTLFKGRVTLARLLRVGRGDAEAFKRIGGVFTVSQQRSALTRSIPRDMWEIISGAAAPAGQEQMVTSDLRAVLLELAVKAQVAGPAGREDDFHRLTREFERLCAPRRLLGVVRDERDRFDLRFTDGRYEYGFDGLSGGEAMVLLLLTRLVADRMHRSVLFADEVELHQHPLWQRRLWDLLGRMGEGNQIIATTHSPYLRDVVPDDDVIRLGDLGDAEPRALSARA